MKPKFIFLLAIVMGIITTILFYQYTQKVNGQKTATEKTVEIVVAKEKIDQNQVITAKQLETVSMPEKEVLSQSFNNAGEVEGKMAASVIEKGEPILSNHLVSEQEESVYVSRKVSDGYRAVSIGVDFNQSVSNLIEPEDLVDVVYTKNNPPGSTAPLVSVILLRNVRVLAVGRQIVTPDQPNVKYVEYSSVTLEVKPEDAVKLINASVQGKIHLMLYKRPEMDENNTAN